MSTSVPGIENCVSSFAFVIFATLLIGYAKLFLFYREELAFRLRFLEYHGFTINTMK